MVAKDAELLRRVEQLVQTVVKIRLMTNSGEMEHQKLVGILDGAITSLRTAPIDANLDDDMSATIDSIITVTQTILKHEWLRVRSGR